MNEIVRGLDFCYVYLDDILVIKNRKTSRASKEIILSSSAICGQTPLNVFSNYLRFHFCDSSSKKGLAPLPQKVEAITNFPEPQDVKGH